ncbi:MULTISPECIES: SAM-dependent methyltransferase [Dickeya]|uniref:Cyclopropane-fatty-acyl-phospholipid synthase, plant type n=1 Tax=Dickeya aquatica TaxID=1401087 RepID=A0A375AAC6_9GAMM|nr:MULTISPECIES: cyclopropane-fatty-acyl-phospholipid synthase family protein [Dickeya]SLM63064.1 Cyclopropane-fatty-acyl-phospholipid synthase, plant type [Dickeya aquatica]
MNNPAYPLKQRRQRTVSPARRIMFRLLSQLRDVYLQLDDADGTQHAFGHPHATLQAQVTVHNPVFYRQCLLGGGIGAAESYLDGAWSTPDLTATLLALARNSAVIAALESRFSLLLLPFQQVRHLLHRNTRHQARRNIAAHYDLGNAFYQRFLDPSMLYSSALYSDPNATLEQAQQAKLRRLCEQLQLNEHDHLLEIGSGWGEMALFAAREYGCRVTTTTVSNAQYEYTCERVRQAGLDDRITVLCQDYRDLSGQYDKIVSIEMIEAVGKAFLPVFFQHCQQRLKPGGRLALQAITISDQRYARYSRRVDFIQRYIFPGGFLPSITVLNNTMTRHTRLVTRNLHDMGLDYARTLHEWRTRFLQHWAEIAPLGFDERFRRLWLFYLCYCEAGFMARTISTVQITAECP